LLVAHRVSDLPASDSPQFAADDRFVRALLRRLVGDRHLVDDLAQETWLAAVRHSRNGGAFGRAWLGTVARNFVLQALRGALRRQLREQATARDIAADAAPTDGEHRGRVLAAVQSLPAPYGELLRLRYFDDLLPTEIAAKLQRPIETVRTQLKRALQRLHRALR
jgi:RNA polymerase sigma-70 factor (ECF subfamily)